MGGRSLAPPGRHTNVASPEGHTPRHSSTEATPVRVAAAHRCLRPSTSDKTGSLVRSVKLYQKANSPPPRGLALNLPGSLSPAALRSSRRPVEGLPLGLLPRLRKWASPLGAVLPSRSSVSCSILFPSPDPNQGSCHG